MQSRIIKTKKAFAFSITMWIIASLLFATVVILRFAKDELTLSKGLKAKLQTQMMAQSVFEALKFYVPTADYTSSSLKNDLLLDTEYPLPAEMIVDGREYNISKNITISLKDTSGMLNVMYTSSDSIAIALNDGANEKLTNILKSTLEDWKDEDDAQQSNGAEQNSYESLNKNVIVRNSKAIQDIHELKLIEGFDRIDFTLIDSNLYYGYASRVNLMLVENKQYLAFLFGVEIRIVENLLELRKENFLQYRKNIMQLERYDDEYMGFWLSKQFMIKIKVEKNGARSMLKSIINFKKIRSRPYLIISYRAY